MCVLNLFIILICAFICNRCVRNKGNNNNICTCIAKRALMIMNTCAKAIPLFYHLKTNVYKIPFINSETALQYNQCVENHKIINKNTETYP